MGRAAARYEFCYLLGRVTRGTSSRALLLKAEFEHRCGEFWLTAMGDVPPTALRHLVDAVERRR